MIGNWMQKIKQNKRRIGVGALALFLAGVMGVNLLQNSTSTIYAANDAEIVVDPDTTNDWETLAASSNSTENVGRIWTDKSVFDNNGDNGGYTLSGNTSASGTKIKANDSDFLVGLSAIASSSNLKTTTSKTTPLDVVLVLDDSGSMDETFGSSYYTYDEVNANNVVESHGHMENILGSDIATQDSSAPDYYAFVNDEYVRIQEITQNYSGDWWTSYQEHIRWELNGQTITPETTQFYRRNEHSAPSRTEALQTAVNNFIDEAAKTNATINETENKIRISIVVYEDDAQTENGLTICEGNNVDGLKETVERLNGNGATNAGAGMTNANRVLLNSNRQNADQVVIFFTDGVPTTYSNFDNDVANTAVTQARQIKNRGASVYSIGVFDGADPSVTDATNNSGETRKANTFMNAVSSNYPNSQSWNNLGNRVNETAAYYKTASDSTQLNQIFNEIFDESTENIGSGSPIEESSGAQGTPGNLIFTDQLGKYMEVTGDTMYLVFADGVHEGKSNDGGLTWQFTGSFQANDIYPAANLSNIKVSVNKSGNGDVVTVTIPASLLPMRHYSVDSNKGTLDVSNTYPIRLFYGVSLKQEAEDAVIKASGETYSEIVNSQKSDDGKINFYSNNYSENQAAGLTTATFTPSDGNKFYYYTENTQLYTDPDCTIQANRYNAGDTLYYKNPYWTTDSNVEVTNDPGVVQSGGSEWSAIQYDGSGNAYIPSGTHRTDRPQTLVKPKTENKTTTANNVITPAWGAGEIVNISLGNNGRISYPALGELEIKKSVDWGNASDETKTNKNSFTFTVNLKDKEGVSLPGEYSYYVGGEEEAKGVVKDGGTVTINGGQSVVIRGLPDGAQFEVLEKGANTNGFTTTDDYSKAEENADTSDGKVNGTIVGGSQESVTFTNVYDANDVNLSSEAILKVQKNLSGRDWRDTDEFVFEIDALGNTATSTIETPKPADTTIKIDENTNNYIAQFGDITFTAPGEYRYAITEDSDTNPINGIDYSAARYRVVIKVIDDGMGQLVVESVDIEQRLDDEGSVPSNQPEITDYTMTFTNKYQVDTATTNIDGVKNYNDYSGGNSIDADKFSFQLKPLGGYVTAVGSAGGYTIDASEVPTSNNTKGQTVTTTNTGYGFGFGTISYQSTDVDKTYVYEVSEVVTDKDKEIGMQYDNQKYVVEVVVSEVTDDQGTYIVATPNKQPNELTFTNTYDPDNAKLTGNNMIHGTKTLTGRELKPNEEFYFLLTAKNDNAKTVLENPKSITVNSLENGSADFNFGELEFSKVGTYIFEVNEVANIDGTETTNGNGLIYDSNICTVEVTVTDNHNGSLEAEVTYSNDKHSNTKDKAEFINSYKANMNYGTQGAGGINVTKILENLKMDENAFQFAITDSNPDDDITLTDSDKQFGNDSAAANEIVSMPKLQSLVFDQDDAGKTYTFVVDEVEPEEANKIPGVTYDQSQYQVDIQVFDNGDGNMHTETTVTQIVDSNGNKVENPTPIIDKADSDSESYQIPTFGFVNTYKAEEVSLGDQAIKVKKTLDGRNWTSDDKFEFTLTPANDITSNAIETNDVVMEQPDKVTIIKDTEDYVTTFGDITFKKDGTYLFNVNEIIPEGAVDNLDGTYTLNGITYSNQSVRVQINVIDNLKGSLVVEKIIYDGNDTKQVAEFVNTYDATGSLIGSDNLKVTKHLGRNWLDTDSFEFVLDYDHDHEETVNAVENGYVYPANVDETEIVIKNSDDVADNDESGSFGNLVFEKPGTYQFVITEKTPDGVDDNNVLNGITYSKAKYQVTVTVTDNNNGTLNVSSEMTQLLNDMGDESKGTDVETALFTNTYSTNPGTTTEDTAVKVKKTLSGREWTNDDEFTFTISIPEGEDYGTNVTLPENTEVTITNATEDFTASFGDITFSKEGTYTFNINEVIPQEAENNVLNGITYDAQPSTVNVTVSDNDQGQLIIEKVVYDNDESLTAAEFTNTYSATGTTSIKVTKDLKGRNKDEWIDGDAFNFTLASAEDYGTDVVMPQSTTLAINKDTADHKASFGDITFNKAGDYEFKVTEDNDEKDNVTYSTEEYTVSVHVEDVDGNGTYTVTSTITNGAGEEVESIVFENTYTPSSVTLTGDAAIHGTKTLTGRDSKENETFNFTLTEDEKNDKEGYTIAENGNVASVGSLTDGQASEFNFGDITFTKRGTYTFYVNEVLPEGANESNGYTLEGVTYDNHKETVKVTVTDDYEHNTLVTKVEYDEDGVAFTNEYDAESITTGTDTLANPQVTKKVTGAPATEEFEFVLELTSENAENVEGLNKDNQITKSTASLKGKAPEATETVDFGQITFKEEGIYTFAVKETTTTDKDGWTYDNTERVITYTVTDTDHDGFLEATTNVEENGEVKDTNNPVITNKYEAGSVTLSGENSLKVTKKVTGAPAIEEFQFTLALTEGDASGVIGLGENNQITLSTDEMTGENAQTTDTVNFGELTFSKIGRYVFTVTEATTTDKLGWTYDNTPKTITVDVTDDGFDGQLDATTVIDGKDTNNPTVTNKYEPNSITTGTETLGNPQVTKVVEGSMATEEFEFTLELTSENAEFVEGLDENNQITLSTDQMTGENAQTTDTVDFGQLTFSKVGDYVFTVTENTQATVGGWTYDNSPKTITYHVTDDGYDGQLDATTVIDGKDTNNPTVTNKYEAAEFIGIPTDFTLTKVFEGKEWSTEDVFEFTLTAGDNTADVDTPMPANTTVQVNAPTEKDGKTAKFNFGSIPYDTVGEYHYTVSEVEGTNVGIDYSKNVAEITVTVTDNKQGGLVASANVVKGTFTNTYSSELDYVGKGGIELVKNLTGHDLADDQFTFTLKAEDEASRAKAGMENMSEDVFNTADTMDENGLSTSTIQLLPNMAEFTQEDVGKVYKYTVSETSEQQPGYTNDTNVYTIEISTSDDGAGTLTVTTLITGTDGTKVTYPYTQSKAKAETVVAQIVFDNTYTSSTKTEGYDASVNLTGTKTLTNRPMVANEFNFQVIDNKGNEISTGTNTADGTVAFTPINYTNTQLIQDHANGIASKDGNTYTYVYDVKEVTPQDPGTTIVAGEFSVTVEVTDNGDGKLTTNVIYPETGLAFENAYGQSANAELNIHGTKKLAENGTNHPDITGKFQFTITGSDGAPMPEQTTVTNDASGNINFGKIVYTMQNVFGDDGQQTILEEEPVVDQEMPIAEEQTTEDGTVSEDVVGLTEQVETYSEKREKTFTYTITESGSLPGVTNDSAKVINVKVIDNGDGTISVTSDTQGTFTFVNTYVPDPTDETSPTDSAVTIKKVLDGRTLKADEFSFTMMDENGNGVQATNAEDGSVVFPKLTFDKEGIYTYTISETNDNKGGVTYDTTTYKAIATVTDDTSGKLKVEWKVTDAQGKEINEITFNNKYTVQPTSLTLGATKVLEGRELADKEFLFVLSDEEGNVVEEAYNDKTGKVTFSDLTFDKAGTYNYTVTEKNTNAKGITYDESVYNIQVEVVDNEDGTLNMTTTTTKDGEVSSIVFRNKAEKDSVPEQPEKGDTSNTSTRTFAGLFTSLAVDAAALAGIATLLKKRNAKK